MGNGLDIAPPPRKKEQSTGNVANDRPKKQVRSKATAQPTKFDNLAEGDKVQFNKRVNRSTADGFDMLAIVSRRKVPELLDEALDLLKEKYGQI